MNNKGVLFTAIAFLMVLSIIALNTVIKENRAQEQHFVVPANILRVSGLFENINESVIELKKSQEAVEIEKRVLPFDYSFDENSLSIELRLPFRAIELGVYFDTLNFAEIMLEDKNYENVYSGLAVDINTVKNAEWGGTDNGFEFLVEPYCYEFSIIQNKIEFRESKSAKCLEEFDFSNTRRIDLNIVILQFNEDYNSLECTPEPCEQQAFNANNPNPYFSLNIDDSNCDYCDLEQNSVSMHFDPENTQEITLSCQGEECNSTPVEMALSEGVLVDHNSSRIGITLSQLFSSEIDSFKLLDFNVTVSTLDGKIVKSNNPSAID